MRYAEFKLLKKYSIDYMSPWGRFITKDSHLSDCDATAKSELKSAYSKFCKWNNDRFSVNPQNYREVIDIADFHYQVDPNPGKITGYAHIPINQDEIEFIEIVEYNVIRFNEINYESIILVKYEGKPLEHYWNSSFYEDCGQCSVNN
jgi:hypothetical protein